MAPPHRCLCDHQSRLVVVTESAYAFARARYIVVAEGYSQLMNRNETSESRKPTAATIETCR